MYEILKEQFNSKNALTQSKHHAAVKRELWPKFYWDLFPLAQEYYHELNPFFLFNLYNSNFFKFSRVFTVRDGYVTFANFILANFPSFKKQGIGLLLIHPDLAPLVPPSLASHFACWHIVQKKQLPLEEAKKVVIFGFATQQYLGDLDTIHSRIHALSKIKPEASLDLYVPLRKNVFEKEVKESTVIHHVMSDLKDVLGNKKFRILGSDHFFNISGFKDTYVFDMANDRFTVSDNYVHYYVQSQGGTVNNGSLTTPPADSIFSLDLSFHHELHITPLPEVKNYFTDLVFYRKQNPSVKDLNFDPGFHGLLRELLAKEV